MEESNYNELVLSVNTYNHKSIFELHENMHNFLLQKGQLLFKKCLKYYEQKTWNSITAKKPPTLDKYLHHRIILLARKIKNAQGQAGACHGNMGYQIFKEEYKTISFSKESTTYCILQ